LPLSFLGERLYKASLARDSKEKGDAVKTPQYIAGLTG
jgi:hypothetical protein